MNTEKLNPVYGVNTKESGDLLSATEWNDISTAVHDAHTHINSLVDDVIQASGTTSQRPSGADVYVGYKYFDTDLQMVITAIYVNGNTVAWAEPDGTVTSVSRRGSSSNRPAPRTKGVGGNVLYKNYNVGFKYYDTDHNCYIYATVIHNDDVQWEYADGYTANRDRAGGGGSSRPDNSSGVYPGFTYFDTGINKLIVAKSVGSGGVEWVDTSGNAV